MNPVLQETAATAQLGWMMGVMTVVFLSCFVYWAWWAYAPRHRSRMDEDARIPLGDGDQE